MKFYKLTSFFIILLVLASCNRKPQALWQEPLLAVIADRADWAELEDVMKGIFEKEIRTPQNERTYVVWRAPDSLFDYYSKQKYVILAGTFESKGPVGNLLNSIATNPTIRQSIESGENFVFTRDNEWAYNQTMIILIGKDIRSLKQKIETHREFLYNLVESKIKKHMVREVLVGRINQELTDELMTKYQFNMQMQKDYFLAQDFPEKNFLWMHRLSPDRWVFVRWWDEADPDILTKEWILDERDIIGRTYYTDYREQVNRMPKYLSQEDGDFQGRDAIITTGLWERIDDTAGGPFKNYTFYDPGTERIYMIDVAVYAPGKEKLPYLRRVDIIAETFRTLFDEPYKM